MVYCFVLVLMARLYSKMLHERDYHLWRYAQETLLHQLAHRHLIIDSGNKASRGVPDAFAVKVLKSSEIMPQALRVFVPDVIF